MPRTVLPALITALSIGGPSACSEVPYRGDPNLEVATLSLQADTTGALRIQECIEQLGEAQCAPLPNPRGCESLEVSVRGDGSTIGPCRLPDARKVRLTSLLEGIPVVCRVIDASVVQCVDSHGTPVVDSSGGPVFRRPGRQEAEGEPEQPVATGSDPEFPGEQPVAEGEEACTPRAGAQLYAAKLNEILAAEGLKFTYQPSEGETGSRFGDWGGFDGFGEIFDRTEMICGMGSALFSRLGCDENAAEGNCYCTEGQGISEDIPEQYRDRFSAIAGPSCRCGRITAEALRRACAELPSDCDSAPLAQGLLQENSAATMWLNARTVTLDGSSGGDAPSLAEADTPGEITCQGSPLVLDLEDDGLALSSLDQGVRFDLGGAGALRTAWIDGDDDALLAIDRNGNGMIDSGLELFGEALTLAGGVAQDGFAALAVLDQPALGGDGNGLVNADDLLFDQLLLWTDRNRDAISQGDELASLADAGIAALQLTADHASRVHDCHGNDLSKRARFVRSDGSQGTVVDVYFVTRR